jgi:hypothetical protein
MTVNRDEKGSGPWMMLAILFGITTVGAVAWGISVQRSATRTAEAGAAAAVNASAQIRDLEGRLVAAEDRVRTLQGIADQTTAHQAAQEQRAQSDQSTRIAQLEAQLSALQARPVSAPAPFAVSAPSPEANQPALRIFGEAVAPIEQMSNYVKWSWRARVSNPASVAQSGLFRCELLDLRGFRLESDIKHITVPAGGTLDVSGEGMSKNEVWARYKRHRVSIE